MENSNQQNFSMIISFVVNQQEREKVQRFYSCQESEIKDINLVVHDERRDDWANKMQATVLCVHDLHATDVIY